MILDVVKMVDRRINKGFTLAEVLITLAIIGVVAALTIPTVIRNYQERETVSALKKFYSQISQAFKMAEIENGPIETWNWVGLESPAGANNVLNIISPYLKITKNCKSGDGCFAKKYKNLPGGDWFTVSVNDVSTYAKARLADGMSFWIISASDNCTFTSGSGKSLNAICGSLGVDLNGDKKPNTWGKDTFYFRITKYGFFPMGAKDDTMFPLSTHCRMSSQDQRNGYACGAWILGKDNMDYLKRDISW